MYEEQLRLATTFGSRMRIKEANSLPKGPIRLYARDRYMAGHSAAAAIYAREIARCMELGAEMEEVAHLSGLVDDIGKIDFQRDSGRSVALMLDERKRDERHPEIGERILANVDMYSRLRRLFGRIMNASMARDIRMA